MIIKYIRIELRIVYNIIYTRILYKGVFVWKWIDIAPSALGPRHEIAHPSQEGPFAHPPSWRTSGVRGWLSLSTNPRATRLSRIINMTVHPLKEDGRRRVSVVLRACVSISAASGAHFICKSAGIRNYWILNNTIFSSDFFTPSY